MTELQQAFPPCVLCPSCSTPLFGYPDRGVPRWGCPSCGGKWIPGTSLPVLWRGRNPFGIPAPKPFRFTPAEGSACRRCPHCRTETLRIGTIGDDAGGWRCSGCEGCFVEMEAGGLFARPMTARLAAGYLLGDVVFLGLLLALSLLVAGDWFWGVMVFFSGFFGSEGLFSENFIRRLSNNERIVLAVNGQLKFRGPGRVFLRGNPMVQRVSIGDGGIQTDRVGYVQFGLNAFPVEYEGPPPTPGSGVRLIGFAKNMSISLNQSEECPGSCLRVGSATM